MSRYGGKASSHPPLFDLAEEPVFSHIMYNKYKKNIGSKYQQSCIACTHLANHGYPIECKTVQFTVAKASEINLDGSLKRAKDLPKATPNWSACRTNEFTKHDALCTEIHSVYFADENGWKEGAPDYTFFERAVSVSASIMISYQNLISPEAAKLLDRSFGFMHNVQEINALDDKCADVANLAVVKSIKGDVAAKYDATKAVKAAAKAYGFTVQSRFLKLNAEYDKQKADKNAIFEEMFRKFADDDFTHEKMVEECCSKFTLEELTFYLPALSRFLKKKVTLDERCALAVKTAQSAMQIYCNPVEHPRYLGLSLTEIAEIVCDRKYKFFSSDTTKVLHAAFDSYDASFWQSSGGIILSNGYEIVLKDDEEDDEEFWSYKDGWALDRLLNKGCPPHVQNIETPQIPATLDAKAILNAESDETSNLTTEIMEVSYILAEMMEKVVIQACHFDSDFGNSEIVRV